MTPSDPGFDQLLRQLAHATEHSEVPIAAASADPRAAAAAYIGQRLGPFLIQELLGVGGMGFVFGALEEPLQRRVALKVLRPELAGRISSAHEARLSASLEHPRIARVYSAGTHADLAWIAFERIPGRPLRDLLRDGQLPSRAAFRILADLADALAHAHSFGLIHRDVKPENAMVRPDGRAVLLDFGVAIPNEGDATPTHRVGTPAYQPPWPVPAGAPTFIDVFALAVVACEVLTCARPIPGHPLALTGVSPRRARRRLEHLLTSALSAGAPGAPHPDAAALADAFELALASDTRGPRTRSVLVAAAVAASASALLLPRLLAAPSAPSAPPLTPLTTRVDSIPITLAALSPDAAHAAFLDASGLTVLDLATRTRRHHTLPDDLSFRYATLSFPRAGASDVSLRFPFPGGARLAPPPTRYAPNGTAHPEPGPATLFRDPSFHLGWSVAANAPAVGPLDALVPVTALVDHRIRGAALSPSGALAALVVSPERAMETCRLVTIDLRNGAIHERFGPTSDLLLLNDHVAVAWRGEDELVAGLYEASAGGGNLYAFEVGTDAPPRRLTSWEGLHFGHLGIGDDGRSAAFMTTIQQNVVRTARLEPRQGRTPATSGTLSFPAVPLPPTMTPTPSRPLAFATDAADVTLHLVDLSDPPRTDAAERPAAWTHDGAVSVTSVDHGHTRAAIARRDPTRVPFGDGTTSWATPLPDEDAWLVWSHTPAGPWEDGVWRLGVALEGAAPKPLAPEIAVPARLTAGRPGPPGAWVRCPASGADRSCVLGRAEPDGPLHFERIAVAPSSLGDPGPAEARLTPLLTLPISPWNAATRWDLDPTGERMVVLVGDTVLDVHLGSEPAAVSARRVESTDRCWPQAIAAGARGHADIVTMSCIRRPIYRMVAVHPDGSTDPLLVSDRVWFSHPQLSPDGRRLAWSERAFQTGVSTFTLPER